MTENFVDNSSPGELQAIFMGDPGMINKSSTDEARFNANRVYKMVAKRVRGMLPKERKSE